MRITKFLALAFMLTAAGFFASCSDDKDEPNKPGDNANYYPYETVGSYWVYETSDVDSVGQKSNTVEDSVFVAKIEMFDGKMTTFLNGYSDGEEVGNVMKVSSSGSVLYAYNDFLLPTDSGIPLDSIPLGWVTIANEGGSQWTLVPTYQMPEIELDFGGVPMKVKISYTATEKKVGQETITYQNKSVKAMKYTVTNKIGGTVTVFGIPVPMNFDVNMHLWFGEDIGLMRQYQEPFTIDMGMAGKQKESGFDQVLIRHSIKAKS